MTPRARILSISAWMSVRGQAVLGDAEAHHPARLAGRLEDGHVVAEEREVVRGATRPAGPAPITATRVFPVADAGAPLPDWSTC